MQEGKGEGKDGRGKGGCGKGSRVEKELLPAFVSGAWDPRCDRDRNTGVGDRFSVLGLHGLTHAAFSGLQHPGREAASPRYGSNSEQPPSETSAPAGLTPLVCPSTAPPPHPTYTNPPTPQTFTAPSPPTLTTFPSPVPFPPSIQHTPLTPSRHAPAACTRIPGFWTLHTNTLPSSPPLTAYVPSSFHRIQLTREVCALQRVMRGSQVEVS